MGYDPERLKRARQQEEARTQYLEEQRAFRAQAAPGPLSAYGRGVKRTFGRVGSGLEEIGSFAQGIGPGSRGAETREAIRQREAQAEAQYAPTREVYPTATMLGESTPYLIGGTGGTIPRAMLTGAAQGLATYTPDPEQRVLQTAIGAGGGALGRQAAQFGAQSAVRPGAARFQQHGGRLMPGDLTGSESLRGLEASMASYPPTAGPIARHQAPNTKLINNSALRLIGESGDVVSGDKLADAAERITQNMNNVTANLTVNRDQRIFDYIDNLEALERAGEYTIPGKLRSTMNRVKKLTFPISGKVWHDLRQDLTDDIAAASAKPGKGRKVHKMGNFLDELENLAMASIDNPIDMQRFRMASTQFRNLKFLEQSGVLTPEGNVSIRSANTKLQKDPAYKRMRTNQPVSPEDIGRFQTVIKDAQILRDIVGNSGTPTRSFIPGYIGHVTSAPTIGGMMGRAAIAPAANLAARAYLRSPQTLYGLIGRGTRAGLLGGQTNSGYHSGR